MQPAAFITVSTRATAAELFSDGASIKSFTLSAGTTPPVPLTNVCSFTSVIATVALDAKTVIFQPFVTRVAPVG